MAPQLCVQRSDALRINVKAFVNDFVAGVSDAELGVKYGLSPSQVQQLVDALEARGDISPEDAKRRCATADPDRAADVDTRPSPGSPGGKVDLDTGLVLHCPSCGAAVKRDAVHCEYCRSHLDFSLTGKTIHCPHCFERIPAASRFCFRCARPVIAADQPGEMLQDRICPRCQVSMATRMVGDFNVTGCEKCGGLFIVHETFEMMQDTSQRVIETGEVSKPVRIDVEKKIAYLRCPVCRTMMNRKNFGQISGVIVDVCGYHGTWFDRGELEKIMDFIAHGGLQRARAREEQRLKDSEILARVTSGEGIAKDLPLSLLMSEHHSDGLHTGLIDVLSKAFTAFKD